ncbi:MAG: amidohydrolase family protein [Vicinamibacteria bacterium]
MKLRSVLALAALAAAPAGAAGHTTKTDVYAIVGARILPVSGAAIENGTLVMRDGLIVAVGAGVQAPAGARVFDGKGLTVTPGLIDGFGGIGLTSGGGRPGAGSGPGAGGAPAAAALPALKPLAPEQSALERIRVADALKARDQGVTTALVVPREGVLPGRSVIVNLSGDDADGMALRQPAFLHLHLSTLRREYPASLMGTLALARQSLLDAARYRDAWADYERVPRGKTRPRFDASAAAWQDVLAGRQTLMVTASRENDIRRALALADEFKIKIAVAGAPQAHRVAELVKQRRLPLLVTVNFDPPRAASFGGFGGGPDDEQEKREIEEAETNPAELHKAGVGFALVSGHAPSFLSGLRRAVEKGLPADSALRASTLAAAEVLGVADRTGSLEAGKIANAVAWSGEPFAKDSKVKLVFVDGQLYQPEEEARSGGRGAPAGPGAPRPVDDAKAAPAATPTAASAAPAASPTAADQAAALAAPASGAIAITGGTIVTMGPQGTIEKGVLVLRDGKIAAVGAGVQVPAGARVIDAVGRYVLPGLIDAHSHTAIEGGVNEGSAIVTAEVRIADVLDQHDVDIYRELAGGVTTINVLHGSANSIGGQNAIIKLRWGVKDPQELLLKGAPRGIKFALGENPKRANFNVPGQRRYPATRMGVEVSLRQAFAAARAYQREWAEYEQKLKAAGPKGEKPPAPRRDLRLETLGDILEGRIDVHAHCYRSDEILMLIRVAEDFGFKIRTFQHVLEGYKVASEIAKHGAGASTFSDWWAYKMEAYDAIPYNAAIMAEKGVVVSMNSDSNELARRLYWEAAKAVKYGGVSEQAALEMVTLNPARQLRIDKWVGSLETGKDADVAIFAAHPLAPGARVEMTLVDGKVAFDRQADLAARPAATAGGAR